MGWEHFPRTQKDPYSVFCFLHNRQDADYPHNTFLQHVEISSISRDHQGKNVAWSLSWGIICHVFQLPKGPLLASFPKGVCQTEVFLHSNKHVKVRDPLQFEGPVTVENASPFCHWLLFSRVPENTDRSSGQKGCHSLKYVCWNGVLLSPLRLWLELLQKK